MTENTAPTLLGVECGYCDEEAVRGPLGSLECPECGRGIEAVVEYAGRGDAARQIAQERHE